MALTIRPSEKSNKCLKAIQKKYSFKTASKAIDMAVQRHIQLIEKVDDLERQKNYLQNQLKNIKNIIQRKNEADQEYKEFFIKDKFKLYPPYLSFKDLL